MKSVIIIYSRGPDALIILKQKRFGQKWQMSLLGCSTGTGTGNFGQHHNLDLWNLYLWQVRCIQVQVKPTGPAIKPAGINTIPESFRFSPEYPCKHTSLPRKCNKNITEFLFKQNILRNGEKCTGKLNRNLGCMGNRGVCKDRRLLTESKLITEVWTLSKVNFGTNELLSYKIQIYLCKPVIPQVQMTVCPQVANLEPVPVPVSTCRTNTMGLPAPVLHPISK
jgi:hypothetical protein